MTPEESVSCDEIKKTANVQVSHFSRLFPIFLKVNEKCNRFFYGSYHA